MEKTTLLFTLNHATPLDSIFSAPFGKVMKSLTSDQDNDVHLGCSLQPPFAEIRLTVPLRRFRKIRDEAAESFSSLGFDVAVQEADAKKLDRALADSVHFQEAANQQPAPQTSTDLEELVDEFFEEP